MSDEIQYPTIRFEGDCGDFVELRLINADGFDLLVAVEAQRASFRGATDTWVLRAAWMGFAQDLTVLEERRQGEARITSVDPEELELVVKSVDRSGHMAVTGKLGLLAYDREASMTFSPMGFDPSTLSKVAKAARRFVAS